MGSRSCLPGLPQKRASTLTKLQIKKIKLDIFVIQFTGHSYKNIYPSSITVSNPVHELQMSELCRPISHLSKLNQGRWAEVIRKYQQCEFTPLNGMNYSTDKRCPARFWESCISFSITRCFY